MKRAASFFVIILSTLLFLAYAIYVKNRQADLPERSLFTGKPCSPPCWQNLTPGKSTQEDVEHFLSTLTQADWPDRFVETLTPTCKNIQYSDASGSSRVVTRLFRLNVEDEILTYIDLIPDTRLTLNQVISHFGDPEYQEAILAVGPEDKVYMLDVYYPQHGMAFKMSTDQKQKGRIEGKMPIKEITYFKPGDLLTYFIHKYHCSPDQQSGEKYANERLANNVRPWTGFGAVEMIETR